MSVYNVYFSPTGGTKKVADIISNELSPNQIRIDILKKFDNDYSFTANDVCVISVPSYGGRVPAVAVSRLKKLSGNGAAAVLVGVFGNRAVEDTLIELNDIAISCGFKPIAAIEAVAEHSLARKYGAGRPNMQDSNELVGFAKTIKSKISNGFAGTLNVPGNRPYKEVKYTAMYPTVDRSCIDCRRCAAECPVDAISYHDIKTIDPSKCFSCMHCISVCPISSRQNSPESARMIDERLRDRCSTPKPNKLYI